MPLKWQVIILLGKYKTQKDYYYFMVKVKRYAIVKNILSGKKQIRVYQYRIVRDDTHRSKGYKILKEKHVYDTLGSNNKLDTDVDYDDPLFSMHNREAFYDSEKKEYIEYKDPVTYKLTCNNKEKFDKIHFLSYIDENLATKIKEDINTDEIVDNIKDIKTKEYLINILFTVYSVLNRSFECSVSFDTKDDDYNNYLNIMLKRGIDLFKNL